MGTGGEGEGESETTGGGKIVHPEIPVMKTITTTTRSVRIYGERIIAIV
jgi:hypothetical protein